MRGPRRWSAPAVMAMALGAGAGAGLPQAGAVARPAGTEATRQPGQPPITVEELLGPDGEPLEAGLHVNQTGQVAALDRFGTAVVWHDGTATPIGGPEPTSMEIPVDISERGQVVGNHLGPQFLRPSGPWSWRNGELTELTPRDANGFVVAVSDRGQILGVRPAPSDPSRAETVVWQGGQVIPAPADAGATAAVYDINDRGRALIGVDGDTSQPGTQRTAAVWRVGGEVVELGSLGGAESLGSAINDRGHVAGVGETASGDWHAFLRRGGQMIDLGTLGGSQSLVGAGQGPLGAALGSPDSGALNERSQVAGTSETASGEEHAFLWRDGEMIDLGTLGGATSRATALNDRGQVVGVSDTSTTGEQHAFLWQEGHMIDLGALAGEGDSEATAINDRGQITGYVQAPGAEERAVLWTAPPPRPR